MGKALHPGLTCNLLVPEMAFQMLPPPLLPQLPGFEKKVENTYWERLFHSVLLSPLQSKKQGEKSKGGWADILHICQFRCP